MPSIFPGFEYDIFISYRHNDNRSGWVTEFVKSLQEELAATIKEPVSIYFDANPHDGLLETHNVDKSLEGKLNCLIFIPIISQTYCDTNSFAWQHEFVAFNKLTKEDQFGRDIKLNNGNVSSRTLPIKIHDLDVEDKAAIEYEIGGVLRAIEFIYREPGVNRPLKPTDNKSDNQNKTDYNNQINKVANAIKEIVTALKNPGTSSVRTSVNQSLPTKQRSNTLIAVILLLFLLSVAGYWGYPRLFSTTKAEIALNKSIAVLPFVNMSNDPEQEYFSDGMTDEVLNRLYKIGDLKVISRTSSMKFKGAKLTSKEIAEQLGVTNILEGSIQTSGNRIKVTVQLIDALADNHLWSETYEREFIDIFSIQADIASTVATELKIKLNQESQSEPTAPTQSKLAYQFYLKGIQYNSTYSYHKAIDMYSKAIQEDSLFALAYAKRASLFLVVFWQKGSGSDANKELARRDIELLKRIKPDLPELKLARAYWHYYGFREYDKALALIKELQNIMPNDAELQFLQGAIFRRQGKWDESILQYERAIRMDPLSPKMTHELCHTYELLHRYEDLLELATRGNSLFPEFGGFKWKILTAEVCLHHDFPRAAKASGLTQEEIGDYKDYIDKKYAVRRSKLQKQGSFVGSYQNEYHTSTLIFARNYYLDGNRPMARLYADSAISFLKAKLPEMADDHRIYSSLGISYATSGQEKKAIEFGQKAIEALPVSRDAWSGIYPEQKMIEIYIILGKYDQALEKIERLLSMPSDISIGWLLVDPIYEPLRNLPGFKKLVEKYKYKGKE